MCAVRGVAGEKQGGRGGVDKFDGWRESGMDAGSAGGGEIQHSGLNQMGGKKRRAETEV